MDHILLPLAQVLQLTFSLTFQSCAGKSQSDEAWLGEPQTSAFLACWDAAKRKALPEDRHTPHLGRSLGPWGRRLLKEEVAPIRAQEITPWGSHMCMSSGWSRLTSPQEHTWKPVTTARTFRWSLNIDGHHKSLISLFSILWHSIMSRSGLGVLKGQHLAILGTL